jgi:hypothetical protein
MAVASKIAKAAARLCSSPTSQPQLWSNRRNRPTTDCRTNSTRTFGNRSAPQLAMTVLRPSAHRSRPWMSSILSPSRLHSDTAGGVSKRGPLTGFGTGRRRRAGSCSRKSEIVIDQLTQGAPPVRRCLRHGKPHLPGHIQVPKFVDSHRPANLCPAFCDGFWDRLSATTRIGFTFRSGKFRVRQEIRLPRKDYRAILKTNPGVKRFFNSDRLALRNGPTRLVLQKLAAHVHCAYSGKNPLPHDPRPIAGRLLASEKKPTG